MTVSGSPPGPLSLDAAGEDVLIARPEAEVEVRAMPPGGAAFLAVLVRGKSLTEATRAACRSCEQFHLIDHLTALLESGDRKSVV